MTIDPSNLTTDPAPSSIDLERAYDWCRAVVRSRARNFYYGLRISPEPERSAVFALYAWMREADDIADRSAPINERRANIERFWAKTERVLSSQSENGTEMWTAFGHIARRHCLSKDVLHDVVLGMHADLDAEESASANGEPQRICATRDELATYCYRVASTVGLCCVRIWGLREGVKDEDAERLAVARGRAFQLTNILRDFAEDYDAGRIYLPTADFEAHNLTPAELRAWEKPEACTEMVSSLISWATDSYQESEPLREMVTEDCAPTLDAMSRIYQGLLAKIARDPSAIVSGKRIRLSSVAKMAIALRCVRAARRSHDR